MQTKDKNIRRVVQEFYENSGPELEYINLSIEKKYIHIFYYQNLYSKFLCLLPVWLWLTFHDSLSEVCLRNEPRKSAKKVEKMWGNKTHIQLGNRF